VKWWRKQASWNMLEDLLLYVLFHCLCCFVSPSSPGHSDFANNSDIVFWWVDLRSAVAQLCNSRARNLEGIEKLSQGNRVLYQLNKLNDNAVGFRIGASVVLNFCQGFFNRSPKAVSGWRLTWRRRCLCTCAWKVLVGIVENSCKSSHCSNPFRSFAMFHTVLLRTDGNVVACGENSAGKCDIPKLDAGMTYTQASAGYVHTMLLRSDGSAMACGDNLFGQCDIPPLHEGMSYIQVCAGGSHTVLLRSDGNAVACGLNNCGQCTIPQLDEGVTYIQVSAGADHTVLLRSDGSAVACGLNLYGRCNIPRLDQGMAYTQVSAGGLHTVLLRSDGTAVAFGENLCGQCDVPCLDEGMTYIQVCAGNLHTVLLRNDGRAVAFGEDCDRQCNIPSLEERVKYIEVFAGNEHTVLLKSDGNAVACGRNDHGQCAIPPLEPGICYLGRQKPIGPDLVLQVNFVCADDIDDAVALICSTLAGEEKLTLTAHGPDPVWDLHKRIARELNVDLQSLRVVLFDGQLLAKTCQANPVAKVADLNSQVQASHLPAQRLKGASRSMIPGVTLTLL